MRALCLIPLCLATPAAAHIGHLGEVAGHGHWIGLGAIGLAVLVGLLGKKAKTKDSEAENTDEDTEEQPA